MQSFTKNATLRITSVKILAIKLHSTPEELTKISQNIPAYDENDTQKHVYQKSRSDKNGKTRNTKTPIGRFREINDNIQKLLQSLSFPYYVIGGLKGGDNIKNAGFHIGKPLLIRIDLKSFFPNISQQKVYKMFMERQGCSKPVATILTRLTTFKGKLPEGYPTSTLIATLVSDNLAKRLHGFSRKCGVVFTQYIDDFLFSGSKSFSKKIDKLKEIIQQEGFKVNPQKIEIMYSADEQIATGVKVNHVLDAPKSKVLKIKNALSDFKKYPAKLKDSTLIRSLEGWINYLNRLNPGAGKQYKRKLNKVLCNSTGANNLE